MRPRTGLAVDDGFSLTELVVSAALLLVIVSAAVEVAGLATDASLVQPEAVDLQQRARAAAGAIFRDLYVAGAGLDNGESSGPLGRHFAAILPRRVGAESPDSPMTVRPDAVSVLWVPATRIQASVVAPFSSSSIVVRQEPGCPFQPACGIHSGTALLVFDRSGAFDLFSAEAVTGQTVAVRVRGPASLRPYGDDARVAEVEARTYYLDQTARQLRRYDTDRTDAPVVDDVVGMTIEYWGVGELPAVGPSSPAGSCLYDETGRLRLALSSVPAGPDGLAPLPITMFGDGPWCGAGGTAYDADLLRVRRVRVTLRLQVAPASLRGVDDRFAVPGTSRSATRLVPDLVVPIDVSLRNVPGAW